MDWLQVVVLALIQGLTEFLPVSSSAHLILVPMLTDWPDQGLAFDVALHIGSLVAVLLYFRTDLALMATSWTRSLITHRPDQHAILGWAVILGTVPAGLAALAFKDVIETELRSPVTIAIGFIVFGLLLGWADWRHRGQRSVHQITWQDILIIGLAQAVSLFPGTSRSGITMTAALIMGLSREASARFSFLLSIPVIVLASGLEMAELLNGADTVAWHFLGAGILLSGLTAYLCIHYFLAFIQRIGLQPFVAYRLLLGGILLWIFL